MAVTPETVQSVVATLSRPDSYYRELTVETLWSGGSYSSTVQYWEDSGWSHIRQTLASGAVRHDLVGAETAYYLSLIHIFLGVPLHLHPPVGDALGQGGRACPPPGRLPDEGGQGLKILLRVCLLYTSSPDRPRRRAGPR